MTSAAGPALPLSERLRPRRLAEVVGNPRALAELRAWAERWRSPTPPARRAVVLSGPPGVGKTTAALALASEMGWSLVEMNASDARNQSAIDRVAGRASVSHSLGEASPGGEPRRALILLDEADCLTGRIADTGRTTLEPVPLREFLRGRYGTIEALNGAWGLVPGGKTKPFADWNSVPRSPGNFAWGRLPSARKDLDEWRASGRPVDTSDRGGLGAIARLVRSTHQPLVLTVNDDRTLNRYSAVFRTSVLRIRFQAIGPEELLGRLGRIARSERIDLAPGALPAIVARARGDLRAALNDLDAIAPLPPGPSQLEVLGARDRTADFAGLTAEALTSARMYRGAEVRERLDATPDDLLPWIEENIVHYAPDPAHRAAAFRTLAVAEIFLMRARRARVYVLWSYASELLTGGVGLALRERPVSGSGEAAFPRFLGEMGQSRGAREVRDSLASKVAEHFHLSRAKVRSLLLSEIEGLSFVPRGRKSTARETALRLAIGRELGLTPEEAAFLYGVSVDDPEVAGVGGAPDDDLPPSPELPAGGQAPPEPGPSAAPAETSPRKKVQRNLSEFGA
ncbi:MAG TPA: AAA family ATPase [Thermoplasmata archaeon]|nr:AAA family ATPase [Thermoplasmata archaeon]